MNIMNTWKNIWKNKITKHLFILLAFLLYSIALLQLYKNTIDDFAPKHIGTAYMLLKGYKLKGYPLFLFRGTPAFHAFIAELMGITGINEYHMPILPFEFVPYFIIIFVLNYKLVNTKNYDIFGMLLLLNFIYFFQDLAGTHFVFLWPHGIGEILFFTALLLILKTIRTNDHRYLFLIIVVAISLILTSYDVNFWLLLFVSGMIISIYIIKLLKHYAVENVKNKLIFLGIFIFVIFVVYNIYISSGDILRTVLSVLSISEFLKTTSSFFVQYFTHKTNSEIYSLLLVYPRILTYIYLLKYSIYVLIILFGFIALKKLIKSSESANTETTNALLYYFSALILTFGYSIIRIAIGHFAITMIFYIVMFSIPLIIIAYRNNQKITKVLFSVLIVWLILNFSAIYISQGYNIVHNYSYDYIIISSLWGNSNIPTSADKIVFPDQLTFAWWFISYTRVNNADQLGYLWSWKDISGLYSGKNIKSNVYLPLNYKANYIFANTGGWNILKPLRDYRSNIETNPSIKQKIYTNGMLVIVHT